MAIAIRTAHTTWEGPLASGTGTVRTGSGAAGELPVTVVAAGLAAATVAAVVQARRMTRLRQEALRDPGAAGMAAKVRRGARNAAVLRGAIAVLSLALLGLGTVIAT